VNAEELICTAAMIAPSYLLTAAHCVYLPNTKFIAAGGITYAAGQEDATVTPYGVVTAAQTFVPTGYSTRANADTADDNYNARRMYDWAVIKLQSAVGQQARAGPPLPCPALPCTARVRLPADRPGLRASAQGPAALGARRAAMRARRPAAAGPQRLALRQCPSCGASQC